MELKEKSTIDALQQEQLWVRTTAVIHPCQAHLEEKWMESWGTVNITNSSLTIISYGDVSQMLVQNETCLSHMLAGQNIM